MAQEPGAQPIGDGRWSRWTAGLAVAILVAVSGASAGDARRIAYLPVPIDETVLPRWIAPRIAYPRVPRNDRLADPFVYDDLIEPVPSAAEMLAANGQDYSPRPAIWKIADHDTTIYLFGTVHVLPPGFVWRNAGVDRMVAESTTLIVESVDEGGLVDQPIGPALPPLLDRVSPGHRAKLAAFMADLPPEAAASIDGLPTWTAAVAVGFVRDFDSGEIPGPGADDWLERQFKARGRRIESIEDGGKVLARVNAIPAAEQRRMLDAALDARQPSRAERRAPIHAWARGDVGPRSALTIDMARSSGSALLNDTLVVDRNRAWAASLKQRLAVPGVMLFAGGAGHFVGRGSVIELLGRAGVKVVRVQ